MGLAMAAVQSGVGFRHSPWRFLRAHVAEHFAGVFEFPFVGGGSFDPSAE